MILRYKIVGIILIVIILSCQTDKTPLSLQNGKTEKPIYYTRTISGYVQMEHQTNHDNCAIFLNQVNIGTYTDSSGFYQLTLPDTAFENDTLKVIGTVQLYFYSFNFFLDSLQVAFGQKGIILDSLSVTQNGIIKNMTLKEEFSIRMETDTTYYSVGDTIWMTLYIKKYSAFGDTIELTMIDAASKEIGPVFVLYQLPEDYYLLYDGITSDVSYVLWSDSNFTIGLYDAWTLSENFFKPPLNYKVGYYLLIPFIKKTYTWIDKWWRIPQNMYNFLPGAVYMDTEYLFHPKKFSVPKIYLDSLTTINY